MVNCFMARSQTNLQFEGSENVHYPTKVEPTSAVKADQETLVPKRRLIGTERGREDSVVSCGRTIRTETGDALAPTDVRYRGTFETTDSELLFGVERK